ncbi:DUF2057 family protein [Halopseudomonas salina]|uniref:DUF2057 domain-containing protein n=1 Tax=Halopseudomonas salina TaxID=1323744 RepID=A0ABQ1PZ93_9GAMM|nr:DUF2057 family protein [Halopseudomonas salina]GGD08301.1 hypothetical protein GCM10007418_29180 [Halopseudomonas salina]
MRNLFVIAVACMLAACAQREPVKLYSGAEQPTGQILVVEMPYTLEVLNINGNPVPEANRMSGNQDRKLELQPGEYRINAYYENVYDINGGLSSEVVRTRSATYTINGKAGEVWRLDFDAPMNLKEAEAMKDDFAGWSLNKATGERYATEPGPAYVSLVGQLMGGGSAPTYDTEVKPLGAANQAPAAAPVAPVASSQATAAKTLPHNDATLTTLQQLWLLLGPESRDAFLEWAQQ